MNSAIYFLGNKMNKAKITDIAMASNNKPYANVIKRTRWVEYMNQNLKHDNISNNDHKGVFDYTSLTQISYKNHIFFFVNFLLRRKHCCPCMSSVTNTQ